MARKEDRDKVLMFVLGRTTMYGAAGIGFLLIVVGILGWAPGFEAAAVTIILAGIFLLLVSFGSYGWSERHMTNHPVQDALQEDDSDW